MRDNSGKRWSDDEIAMVRRLVSEGVKAADLAAVLGRTAEGIHYMRARIKYENALELPCARCGQVRPAAQFRPSQRYNGGYCASCSRAYRRRTEQAEALALE